MTAISTVQITFDFQAIDSSDDQQEKLTQNLYQQLVSLERSLEDVEINRVEDPNPPDGNRGAAFLWGLLQAKVSYDSIKTVCGFVGDRLGNKPIKVKAKFADGREIDIEASSRVELDAAAETIERLSQPPAQSTAPQ
jgi:hypothetical protein